MINKAALRPCVVQYKINSFTIEGLLVLKLESGKIEEITPPIEAERILKICTFKIDAHNTKLGQRFIQFILKTTIKEKIQYCYVTAFAKHEGLASLLIRYGFTAHGFHTSTGEQVYVKNMNHTYNDLEKDYPRLSLRNRKIYGLGIRADYHTRMFPESILHRESFQIVEDLSYTNAIQKIYVCRMQNIDILQPGDVIFIYRMKANHTNGSAYYESCITSVCVVTEIRDIKEFTCIQDLHAYTSPYNLFSEEDLTPYFTQGGKVISMTYNAALPKKIIRKEIMEIIQRNPYWGFFEFSLAEAKQILKQGNLDESFIID